MGKYDPLRSDLEAAHGPKVEMTFEGVAALVGGLPASALDHRACGGRTSTRAGMCKAHAWLDAGWEVETVDLGRGGVVFRRAGTR